MADNDRKKQLDRLLDSLLSQYSDAQPRPGLETRVLAQIAEKREIGTRVLIDIGEGKITYADVGFDMECSAVETTDSKSRYGST